MSAPLGYCACGDEYDQGCDGRRRCPSCDPPCPCCYDGGGPELDEDECLNCGMCDSCIDRSISHEEEGMVDHDEEDRQAYNAELTQRIHPSEY